MNVGIGDAVDLGWKLAAVIDGWGGERLLDSYEIERRVVHRRVVESAVSNWSVVANRFVETDLEAATEAGRDARRRVRAEIARAKLPEFRSPGLVLGYRYDASPIVDADGTPAPPDRVEEYVPTARPGARAPHRWLVDGSSLYDRFGPAFTLLKLGASSVDTTALEEAARERGLPLDVVTRHDIGLDELYEASLVLIRPDQHVAWRGHAPPAEPDVVIDLVRGAASASQSPSAAAAV
jgi:hypothetical protein